MTTTSGHLYLPQLAGASIKPPEKVGHWMNHEQSVLIGISDAIEVGEKALLRGVSAVPDIWARPLMFQSATRPGSKHPLRSRMIQEWRGLISLLALSRIKKYPLGIIPVELDSGTFSNALRKLAPKPLQLEKDVVYDWMDILLIRYRNIPIGAFSPTTLVYTATKYNHLLKNEDFSLHDKDGYLCPPKEREELEYVGEWLFNLQRNLNAVMYSDQSNKDHKSIAIINDLIDEWLKEIRSELPLKGDEIDARRVRVSDDYLKIAAFVEKYKIYQLLLRPLQKAIEEEGIGEGHSDMALSFRPERNYSKYKEVVIVTEQQLATNIRIWEPKDHAPIYLRDLGGNAKACIEKYFENKEGWGEEIKGYADLRQEEAIWIRPEKYFLTNTLLKAKNGSFLTEGEYEYNSGRLSKCPFILPFKKEVLFFFSPKDINEILQPKYKVEGENVEFSFYLPIAGVNKPIEIKKVYKTKGIGAGEGAIIGTDVPVIEIFPNYLDHHWRRYYVFQGNAENVSINPIVFGENQITERIHDEMSVEPKQKVKITEIQGSSAFPEGLEINNAAVTECRGVVLIKRPQLPSSLSKKWRIGVDFGTSNTNVFKQSSISELAERWQFNFSSYIRRISNSNDEVRGKFLENHFVPSQSIELPVPTTLKIYNLAQMNNLLLDYFIFFPSAYQLPRNVFTDIKWDTEGEPKTKYFMESLLFLLLVEAVDQRIEEVEFACSYPKAFSETNVAVLKNAWEQVLKKMLEEQHRILDRHKDASDVSKIKVIWPVFKTEGIAAGEYFGSEKTIPSIHERAKKEIAAICIDIGGGTTDVSIWFGNNIVFDASVLLAGRQISQLFQKNARLAELLFTREAAMALAEKKNEPAFYAARLNLILKNEEKRIQEMLVNYANEKNVRWLRQMLAVEFCALSFYTAMLTITADKKIGGSISNQEGLLQRVATKEIGLHWGGNAAKFINWIDFGKFDRNGIASKMLSAAYYNCLKDIEVKPNALAHFQSPSHKSEASGGLVVMQLDYAEGSAMFGDTGGTKSEHDEDSARDVTSSVCCGENIELIDGKIGFTDMISGKKLFDGNKTKFKSTSLDRLNRFVDIVNLFGLKFGLFTEDTKIKLNDAYKRTIGDTVMSEFIKAQSLPEGQRLIEPIFMMEIKVLLELLRGELQ